VKLVVCQTAGLGRPATSDHWPALHGCPKTPLAKKNSSSYPPFFAHVVNSCWLAPAHARPALSFPKIFKHP
jgi:hypothetical protein